MRDTNAIYEESLAERYRKPDLEAAARKGNVKTVEKGEQKNEQLPEGREGQ